MAFAKVALACALVVFLGFINGGECVECYKCSDCSEVNGDTPTCTGDYCYAIESMNHLKVQTKGLWYTGCTNTDAYCKPHEGMDHECFVCTTDKCNVPTKK